MSALGKALLTAEGWDRMSFTRETSEGTFRVMFEVDVEGRPPVVEGGCFGAADITTWRDGGWRWWRAEVRFVHNDGREGISTLGSIAAGEWFRRVGLCEQLMDVVADNDMIRAAYGNLPAVEGGEQS